MIYAHIFLYEVTNKTNFFQTTAKFDQKNGNIRREQLSACDRSKGKWQNNGNMSMTWCNLNQTNWRGFIASCFRRDLWETDAIIQYLFNLFV